MSFIIQLTLEAKLEFEELLNWYGDINPQLAIKFLDEYCITMKKITFNPKHYSFIAPNIRRIPFGSLQAMLIYKIDENIVEIIAVKDMRSKPSKHFY